MKFNFVLLSFVVCSVLCGAGKPQIAWRFTPDAEKKLEEFSRAGKNCRLKNNSTEFVVRAQLKYALHRNYYLHRWYDRPLYQNTGLAKFNTSNMMPNNVEAQAMKQALEEAGYNGTETVYVNAHGTGTPMNDSGETLAIKKALGEEAAYKAMVSSTKSMTGHMLGAAGAIEAIVCLKVLETGIVPPTINLNEPDPKCDLNYVPNKCVNAQIDLCLSNSLGFGGHNACLAFRKV